MHGRTAKRLDMLEAQGKGRKGIRVFKQSLDDEAIFYETTGGLPYAEEEQGQAWSREEIADLGAQGWECLVLEYVDDWRGDEKWAWESGS